MKRSDLIQWSQFLTGAGLIAYVIYRAVNLSITYDEAWSILDFVPNSLKDILTCTPCDAGNQMLNTLLIKAFYATGWRTMFMARLPNVIAFLPYVYFAWRIGGIFSKGIHSPAIFLLLLLNPFVLDFFSLARGYGLGLAFQLASIYWILLFARDRRSMHAHWAIALACLAALANLTFLIHLAGLFLLCPLLIWPDRRKMASVIGVNVLILIALAALLFIPLRELLAIDAFYHGGTTGFFADTLMSLARYSTYDQLSPDVIRPVLILLLTVTAGLFINSTLGRRTINAPAAAMGCLLIFCVITVILQHHLLGTRFAIDRGALFLYPLLVLTSAFGIQDLKWIRWAGTIALTAIAIWSINFLTHANLRRTVLWSFDAHTHDILVELEQKGAAEGRILTLDWSWPFRSSIRYYATNESWPHLIFVKDEERDPAGVDVYLYLVPPLENAPYYIENEPVDASRSDTLWSPGDRVHVLTNISWRGNWRSSPRGR